MLDVVVEKTNTVIADILQASAKYVKSRKYPFLKLTTQEEISGLVGLFYYVGLYSFTNNSANICFLIRKVFQYSEL